MPKIPVLRFFVLLATILMTSIAMTQEELKLEDETLAIAPTTPEQKSRWSIVVPSFVMHGIAPSGGANLEMPRRIDSGGRFVITPGVGIEYEGPSSLDIVLAAIKDCYDDYAGTLQVGQYFRWGKTTRFGYTLGLYIRQTPIDCLTTTFSGGGGGGPGNGGGGPPNQNQFSYTSCAIEDNLPMRYTTTLAGGYIDIIPTPFLNFSTQLYDGSFKVYLKLMSNFYLNEFGLSVPF